MGNQARPRIDRYGWTGKTPAQVGIAMGMSDNRCGDLAISGRGPPMPIDEALRNYCNIPGRGFLVVAIDQDYESHVFKSANCPSEIDRFVDRKSLKAHLLKLKNSTQAQGTELSPTSVPAYGKSPPTTTPFSVNALKRVGNGDQYYQTGGLESDDFPTARKRMRQSSMYDDESRPTTPRMAPTPKGRRIRIDNSKDIWEFYEQQFKNCQQTACKLIAKAWVKAVEPKKQSTHPYTGKDEKAPDWWPKPWGNSKDERVRHKEPDHLYKRERVYLLCHILRLVIQPLESQHPAIQKVNLDVKKLDEITMEALSTFFTDKENPNNERKRPYLRDIFKVAKQEERFQRGEIDPSVCVHVRPDERASTEEDVPSQNEDDEPPVYSTMAEPPKQHGPPQIMVSHDTLSTGASAGRTSFSGTTFMDNQPRYHQIGPLDNGGLTSTMHPHDGLDLTDEFIYAGSEGSTRRDSAFQTTNTDFTSPTTPVTSWYTAAATHPTTMYSIHSVPSGHVHGHQAVPLSHNLLGMDDFSRNFGQHPTHGGELHDTSMEAMSLQHQATYSGYAGHHGPGLAGPIKLETHHAGLGQHTSGR